MTFETAEGKYMWDGLAVNSGHWRWVYDRRAVWDTL